MKTMPTVQLLFNFLFLFNLINSQTIPPHIIIAVTDDLGWNYPGYHNSAIKTPTLDFLATQRGVRLNNSYMYKYCSPSRGSLMTGRYPWKMASTRCNFIPSSIPEGIDLGYTFLPKHLAKANYYTSHIGKWHLGFHSTDYTPVARGFNESWGFLEGGEDHWSHKCGAGMAQCHTPGQPFHSTQNWDLWSQSSTNFPGGPLYGTNGTEGNDSTYSGYIFTNKAVNTIHNHNLFHGSNSNDSKPLFMYLALHNTHAPIEAPQRFIDLYNSSDIKQNTFNAMVSVVDETIKNVTDALKENQMWNNTLFIWTTDNGSPVQVGGSNHPLRGGKSTNWQGGVRVPTFITGGYLPKLMHGKTLTGLIHVSDWFATFSEIAGLGTDVPSSGPGVSDSISMWSYISGKQKTSPRTVLIHDHRMYTNASRNHNGDHCNGQVIFEKQGYDSLGAIRSNNYKLIIGNEYEASWFGQFSPNNTGTKPDLAAVACVDAPCLFDVEKDPGEHNNIANSHSDIVFRLWALFNESNTAHHPRIISPKRDVKGFCNAVLKNEGWVAPWLKNLN
tara:strand:- start:2085 stop:3749 length:1665 start_codon:yes stop_codon:yes gene_type:complete